MNYITALDYISSRQRFGSRPGLDSIKRILSLCGDPHRDMRFIHVAGTNGKGSTCVMIASALTDSGKKTGLYISPYVTCFRERIQINGEMISEADFADLITRLAPVADRLEAEGVIVTEFELITAAALMYYKKQNCDAVVLEVGLGGRFDATNIIDTPLVSVIAHIDMDHTAVLGDTIEKIAFEKCGIIKTGGDCVCYPVQHPDAMATVKAACRQRGCTLTVPDESKIVFGENNRFCYGSLEIDLPLNGRHQVYNAVTAIETLRLLGVCDVNIKRGIERVRFAARIERISRRAVLDGAHNPDGMAALADFVRDEFDSPVAIIGMLADKNYEKALSIIAPLLSGIVAVAVPNDRTLSARDLAQTAKRYCDNVACCDDFDSALEIADKLSGGKNVLICGSLYLAAAIREKATAYFKNR